ncbi:hypothetical protein GZH82_04930 [Staphylococcus ursi]|uniref:hypothetical protein n=1 Tax=Staphylococcus sp. MI 10-1553 TaxID=1912064 RepID=UPI00139966D3|nr:hypothetical protein [Staphylococcus sp. MI 10-1553]QHW36749.1 hypothetical protein GZH82_04930 [Staphylococcus sp. MI 10-1553]
MNNLTFSDYFYEISSTSYDGEKKLINLGQGNPHINIEKEALQLLKRLIDNPKSHIYPQASDENILRESLMKRYNSLYNINITT